MKNTYLIQALRSYREIIYGQFDQEDARVVEITQDAANEIERLNEKIEEIKQLVISMDGANKTSGMVAGVSWDFVAGCIATRPQHYGEHVVTFLPKLSGLEFVLEHNQKEAANGD